jgi:hypothetical protein
VVDVGVPEPREKPPPATLDHSDAKRAATILANRDDMTLLDEHTRPDGGRPTGAIDQYEVCEDERVRHRGLPLARLVPLGCPNIVGDLLEARQLRAVSRDAAADEIRDLPARA